MELVTLGLGSRLWPLGQEPQSMSQEQHKGVDRRDFELLQKVARFLCTHVDEGDRILAAVSGGGDSMALLELLATCSKPAGVELAAAYVDHGLRRESAQEEALVAESARRCGAAFVSLAMGDAAGGDENHLREQRYALLQQAARAHDCKWIATGHSFDDQIETLVFRFFRGSGRRGLSGIPARRDNILRPLLGLRREQLRSFLRARGIPWIEDRSNASPRYTRNRIRNTLIPVIEETLGSGVLDRLPAAASYWEAEEQFLESEARRHTAFVSRHSSAGPELDLAAFDSVPHGLQARVLRHWLLQAGMPAPVEIRSLEALRAFITDRRGSAEIQLQGIGLCRQYAVLKLEAEAEAAPGPDPEGATAFCFEIDPGRPGLFQHSIGRWSIRVEPDPSGPPKRAVSPHKQEIDLVYAGSATRWHLRPARSGDHVSLPGPVGGRRKLSDIFGESRIPKALRPAWPVLVCKDEVLWIPGLIQAVEPHLDAHGGADAAFRVRLYWERSP